MLAGLGRPWGRVKALYRSRFRLPRHAHDGTLTHKSPTPAGVRPCANGGVERIALSSRSSVCAPSGPALVPEMVYWS